MYGVIRSCHNASFFFLFFSKVGVTTIFFWLWWAELNHFADRLWPPGHMFDTLGLDSSSPWLFLCFLHLLILSVLSCLFHALHNLQLIASFPKTHTRTHSQTHIAHTSDFSPCHSSAPQTQGPVSLLLPFLYTQVAIISDLIPNSQSDSTQSSSLIIYRLPHHLRPTRDQWELLALFFNKPKVDCCQELSFVAVWGFNSLSLRFAPFMSFCHVLSTTYCARLLLHSAAILCVSPPLLLREMPEGEDTVKAVVIVGLFNKRSNATASQMTCDSYNLFLIIGYICSLVYARKHPLVAALGSFLERLIWPFIFHCVCLQQATGS